MAISPGFTGTRSPATGSTKTTYYVGLNNFQDHFEAYIELSDTMALCMGKNETIVLVLVEAPTVNIRILHSKAQDQKSWFAGFLSKCGLAPSIL